MRLYTNEVGDEVVLASGYWEAASRLGDHHVYEAHFLEKENFTLYIEHGVRGCQTLTANLVPVGVREGMEAGFRNPYLHRIDAVLQKM